MAETASDKSSREEMKALREDLKQIRSDLGELAKALTGEGSEKLHAVGQRAHEQAEAISERAREAGHDIHREVEEHPFTTAVVALCVGLITGAILRGHRS